MSDNEGFVIQLDGPRRLRLTIDSAARFEEESGVPFQKAFRQMEGEGGEAWLTRVLYPFLIADDPALTQADVRKIIDKHLTPLPLFSKIRLTQEIRNAMLKAGQAFVDRMNSGKFVEE
ncbi:MAG: hypothetical protein ABSG19_12430 [Candidatus Aminicenantales bacterium]